MQHYCTPATSGQAIPADDGRSLFAVDQYRVEMQDLGRLSVLEEHRLVELARNGNQEAKSQLIESCLQSVYGLAVHYAQLHPSNSDALDLAQVGNEAIVRHIDEALKSRSTCAFLRLVARRAIVGYCMEDKLIRVPQTSYRAGRRAPLTVSLMAPLPGSDQTVLELLEDADWQGIAASAEYGPSFPDDDPQPITEGPSSLVCGPESDGDGGERAQFPPEDGGSGTEGPHFPEEDPEKGGKVHAHKSTCSRRVRRASLHESERQCVVCRKDLKQPIPGAIYQQQGTIYLVCRLCNLTHTVDHLGQAVPRNLLPYQPGQAQRRQLLRRFGLPEAMDRPSFPDKDEEDEERAELHPVEVLV